MYDPFANEERGAESPARYHQPIVPSNTADLPTRPRVLYCLGAGTVVLRDDAGTDVSYALELGQILPFSPRRVLATGTTATLVGWW